jgi:leucyl aminopeptidase
MRLVGSLALFCAVAGRNVPPREGHRLIEFNESYQEWMSPEQIDALSIAQCGGGVGFIDVTDYPNLSHLAKFQKRADIPTRPREQPTVQALTRDYLCVDGDCTIDLWATNNHLASYHNRYYTAVTGQQAALWTAEQYRQAAGGRLGIDISVEVWEHAWLQPSVIARIIGTRNPTEVVVIGGHIDSTAGGVAPAAPGFDDDGSGSATVLAVFKALANANFRPERTLEFMAYAAEEAGLRGSGDIATQYRARQVDVISMCQFDMTCFSAARTIGMTSDFTDATLSRFIQQLVGEYTTINFANSVCGYGCSDHASFFRQGFRAAFPFEAVFGQHNPHIHTNRDTWDKCDRSYMGEFAKLALAYVVEMGSTAP